MKKLFAGVVIGFALLGGASAVFAQPGTTVNVTSNPGVTVNSVPSAPAGGVGQSTKLENPIQYDNLNDLVAAVLKAAVTVLMPFVVLAFIWSGFLFIRAQGNEEELREAKTAIYWSVIGAFILLGAWGFAEIIASTVSEVTGVMIN